MLLSHLSIKNSSSTQKKKAEAVRKLDPYICSQPDQKRLTDADHPCQKHEEGDRTLVVINSGL